jgi:hypothetical protein
MEKPKLIIDAAVLTHAINVRSYANHVRSTANSAASGFAVVVLTHFSAKPRSLYCVNGAAGEPVIYDSGGVSTRRKKLCSGNVTL